MSVLWPRMQEDYLPESEAPKVKPKGTMETAPVAPVNPAAKDDVRKLEWTDRMREAGAVYLGATMQWMNRLVSSPDQPDALKDVPRNVRLSGAFPGAFLFTLLVGCGQAQVVECTEEEDEYLDMVIDWLNTHPDEIQARMDELWPDQTITARQLIDTLNDAQIHCAAGGDPDDLGTANLSANRILIPIDDDSFQSALELYQEGKWTQDYTPDELVELYGEDNIDVRLDAGKYYIALMLYSEVLAHEAAHLASNKLHAPGVGEAAKGKDLWDRAELDEVYAWGSAAELAAADELVEVDDALR